MIELAAPPTGSAATTPAIGHDRLDQLISRIAGGDRVAFRLLYAFMAMRIWRNAIEAQLSPANAAAVTRSTFVEVWLFAGTAARYDARDWIAALSTRRVNDRLRTIDATGRYAPFDQPHVAANGRNQPPAAADYDTHIRRELTALLGAGDATIRTSPGVFARIDDLDDALAAVAAATPAPAARRMPGAGTTTRRHERRFRGALAAPPLDRPNGSVATRPHEDHLG